MRKQIYEIIHLYDKNCLSKAYKYFMIVTIAASLIPLIFKNDPGYFRLIDTVCLMLFIADYFLRWMTADYKFETSSKKVFLKYPFRLISVIDLLSIVALSSSLFPIFEGANLAKALSVFRVIRIFRYSKNVRTILDILKKSRKALTAVGNLAIGYIVISAIIMFNAEPDSFNTFFDAVYWATVSLTTVGYGDIYPVTVLGRVVAMCSSFFGIAVVALPAGIVTAEYLGTLKKGCSDDSTNS